MKIRFLNFACGFALALASVFTPSNASGVNKSPTETGTIHQVVVMTTINYLGCHIFIAGTAYYDDVSGSVTGFSGNATFTGSGCAVQGTHPVGYSPLTGATGGDQTIAQAFAQDPGLRAAIERVIVDARP